MRDAVAIFDALCERPGDCRHAVVPASSIRNSVVIETSDTFKRVFVDGLNPVSRKAVIDHLASGRVGNVGIELDTFGLKSESLAGAGGVPVIVRDAECATTECEITEFVEQQDSERRVFPSAVENADLHLTDA
jgi:hypothetical protein